MMTKKVSKPNHYDCKPAYGSIAYDIRSDLEKQNELALSMVVEVKKYASNYGLVFDDASELYFSHLYFNPETRTKLENMIKDGE